MNAPAARRSWRPACCAPARTPWACVVALVFFAGIDRASCSRCRCTCSSARASARSTPGLTFVAVGDRDRRRRRRRRRRARARASAGPCCTPGSLVMAVGVAGTLLVVHGAGRRRRDAPGRSRARSSSRASAWARCWPRCSASCWRASRDHEVGSASGVLNAVQQLGGRARHRGDRDDLLLGRHEARHDGGVRRTRCGSSSGCSSWPRCSSRRCPCGCARRRTSSPDRGGGAIDTMAPPFRHRAKGCQGADQGDWAT